MTAHKSKINQMRAIFLNLKRIEAVARLSLTGYTQAKTLSLRLKKKMSRS
jgi:hypothetical protein